MQIANQVKQLIRKEMLLEWRSKYALNGILLYVVSTVFVCFLSFVSVPEKLTWNALFWIIMLFASINAVAKSFLQESKGRHLYIYTLVSPVALIIAKTLYNSLLMIGLTLIALLFYTLVFSFPAGADMGMYLVATVLGSLSFATIFTMVSAIASKAGNGGMLMAILSFPIIIPVLIVLIKLAKNAIDGLDRSVSLDDIGLLAVINVLVMAASLLLFPYLWRD
ncbi:heme exporter protein CcmB [Pedobacter boryungensis]|uniref:Heme exporter protein CcmB n=1 Tax=Pedobacter boryungensis TaxID=869962 RepID=A0ABX2DA49_9SPHI|nr:heme exporter protein CcmB [Pedobacter boryungensis]NQX30293.1 heme exporter protein CcmB [Pedobacter boryungensis]